MSRFSLITVISLLASLQVTIADESPHAVFTSSDSELSIHFILDISDDTTILRIESELPNNQIWFGVSFDATRMSSNAYGVIYNPTYPTLIMDMHINSVNAHNTPTLLPSQWSIIEHRENSNGEIILTLSRPNQISNANYANFNTFKQSDKVHAIWAHGTSSTFANHGRFRTAGVLTSSNSLMPTTSPTLKPTTAPTLCTPPDGTSQYCGTYEEKAKKSCCEADYACSWNANNDGLCDMEGGPGCCKIRTPSPTTSPTTASPTQSPTLKPTTTPTIYPSKTPTTAPTNFPSKNPTRFPTEFPSKTPTIGPTRFPSKTPTNFPSKTPINFPTTSPSKFPSKTPTTGPTKESTVSPSETPTTNPTQLPTEESTVSPSETPTTDPTQLPTEFPTVNPTKLPTYIPTDYPTTANPTEFPSNTPTTDPTQLPTELPTVNPTKLPTHYPTYLPTHYPTYLPTHYPTYHPTDYPTHYPTTAHPTEFPSNTPTTDPTQPPHNNLQLSLQIISTTVNPTKLPTNIPTSSPTKNPTPKPTPKPSPRHTPKSTPKPTVDVCDCEGGFNTLKLKYMGQANGVSIRIYSEVGYRATQTLCNFNNVDRSQVILCDMTKGSKYHTTYFKITYPGDPSKANANSFSGSKSSDRPDRSCTGYFDTSCKRDIVGDICPKCADLKVIGWKDMKNKFCDARYSDNALLNQRGIDLNEKEDIINSETLQWGLVGMGVFIVGCGICICIKCVKKFDNMYYGRHKKTSDAVDGISMIENPVRLHHKTTLSMNDSYVVKMDENDFVR